ncbi:MAG: beta-ketoacyl-[acyl-carrier-protein] synthase family protein [Planctomycetales bacterium]|nr:beta-ketoacyl-[acyl-carrier-protein] synthase family protein [Planctomycetales bacterium]
MREPIVVSGVGLVAAVGWDRESVWQAVRSGESGVGWLRGLLGIPDDTMIGAQVDLATPAGGLKAVALAEHAAREALSDAQINWNNVDRERFGCASNAVCGDWSFRTRDDGYFVDPDNVMPWWKQFLPNTPVAALGHKFGLYGPRLAHSTACASGLVGVLAAVRSIQDGQCDIALAGAADTIDPLFAAGFQKMRVLATHDDPVQACRPFDANRTGFVLGEGAAMFVIERLSHALARGARIYAEIRAGKMLAEAHHVTGLDADADALAHLIDITLDAAQMSKSEVGHINAHGTGTAQNDLVEMRAIRKSLGRHAGDVCVAANKACLGHLINAAGSMELALTVLAMRDGFAPPTLNLTDPDPECVFDPMPLVGRVNRFQHALKISVAFGGHLVALALSRWNDAATGFGYPEERRAAAA